MVCSRLHGSTKREHCRTPQSGSTEFCASQECSSTRSQITSGTGPKPSRKVAGTRPSWRAGSLGCHDPHRRALCEWLVCHCQVVGKHQPRTRRDVVWLRCGFEWPQVGERQGEATEGWAVGDHRSGPASGGVLVGLRQARAGLPLLTCTPSPGLLEAVVGGESGLESPWAEGRLSAVGT